MVCRADSIVLRKTDASVDALKKLEKIDIEKKTSVEIDAVSAFVKIHFFMDYSDIICYGLTCEHK